VSTIAIAAIFLVVLALALITVAALIAVLRVRRFIARTRALREHPVLTQLRSMSEITDKLQRVGQSMTAIKDRTAAIAEATASIAASSAVLRLEVGRVSFATRLLLETLVPTLRGVMAD
jgi:hypothetical protein